MHINKHGGRTYFERWGFSINEGGNYVSQSLKILWPPVIHMSWRERRFFFYFAMTERVKFHFHLPFPFGVRRVY